ncbi:M20/M25/M40 family metallo-hydrolase [Pontibacillus litoralis]|uniref:Arginine utilization protein RocB n=1 Tax=Pontibacillus litoralis JSM 072002 TaxID=1385512 RepID=A0A0A5G4L3_9BACI|nr:M20/M25/M40 family metallo-hydrolase [Pontibacillus litoralis]KGX86005.1 hypothetical protein N784_06455 [Pontibacillus litoralis JSM 072002]
MKWQQREEMINLLCSLVSYPSITGSEAEIALVEHLYQLLGSRTYFQNNPSYVALHPLQDGRRLLTALVKQGNAKDTIILLSHFDVVGIDDFGSRKNIAFHPRELTRDFNEHIEELPKLVQQDLQHGEWLFGRGIMDMKAGLVLHLSLLEKAFTGAFDGNILLVTVPDEEANSLGMLHALPVLQSIQEQEGLTFRACLNGEPMFSQYPGDDHNYAYSGSIGKVLPGFFCYGKETHVGEPFAGLNANLMMSYIAQEMELNEHFSETVRDEITPPPVSLMQRDLKEEYSVQTPQAAISMYNVLYMNQSVDELNNKLLHAAHKASVRITKHFKAKAKAFYREEQELSIPEMNVQVFMYDELVQEAIARYGREEVKRRENLLLNHRDKGDRDFSTLLVQELATLCKDLAPMIVLFYSPPFYPAVSSKQDPYIQRTIEFVQHLAKQQFQVDVKEIEFFPGLSDLSFIGPITSATALETLMGNMPLKGKGFDLTEKMLQMFQVPILNVGPRGKDAHQWTERLELTYSFDQLPHVLTETIHYLLKEDN